MKTLISVSVIAAVVACADPPQPARPTPVQPVPRDAAPPSTPVPAGYVAAQNQALERGRAIINQLLAGEYETVRAMLAHKVRPLLTEETLAKTMDSVRAAGTLSDRLDESALPGLYVAEYKVDAVAVSFTVAFDATGAVVALLLRPRAVLPPDPRADHVSEGDFRLPFSGTWWVFWGGDTELHNYHVVAPDQRHAYDIMIWKDGATHRGDGTDNEQYWAFGEPLLAPADGVVISARSDLRDNKPGVETDADNPIGNHVILDVGRGEYIVMAHMRRGSVKVEKGDRVERGQTLGQCGNSGNTSEPHLHIHLQDQPEPFGEARGLPLSFSRYLADGEPVERGAPIQGQFVTAQK